MRIVARCECGKEYAVKDTRAGQEIKCYVCGRTFAAEDSRPAAPESLIVACPCGKKYRVKGDAAGKSFKCAECGRSLLVPAKDPTAVRDSLDPVSDSHPLARPRADALFESSTVTCQCGERYPLSDASAGGTIACAVCGQTIKVRSQLRGAPAGLPKQYGGIRRGQYFFYMLAAGGAVALIWLLIVGSQALPYPFGAAATPGTALFFFLLSLVLMLFGLTCVFRRYKNMGMNGWWGVLAPVPLVVLTVFQSLAHTDGLSIASGPSDLLEVIVFLAAAIPVLLAGFRCLACPEGYADTRKLDSAGKMIIASMVGIPFLLSLLAVAIALLMRK